MQHVYSLDFSGIPQWPGTLNQLISHISILYYFDNSETVHRKCHYRERPSWQSGGETKNAKKIAT